MLTKYSPENSAPDGADFTNLVRLAVGSLAGTGGKKVAVWVEAEQDELIQVGEFGPLAAGQMVDLGDRFQVFSLIRFTCDNSNDLYLETSS